MPEKAVGEASASAKSTGRAPATRTRTGTGSLVRGGSPQEQELKHGLSPRWQALSSISSVLPGTVLSFWTQVSLTGNRSVRIYGLVWPEDWTHITYSIWCSGVEEKVWCKGAFLQVKYWGGTGGWQWLYRAGTAVVSDGCCGQRGGREKKAYLNSCPFLLLGVMCMNRASTECIDIINFHQTRSKVGWIKCKVKVLSHIVCWALCNPMGWPAMLLYAGILQGRLWHG